MVDAMNRGAEELCLGAFELEALVAWRIEIAYCGPSSHNVISSLRKSSSSIISKYNHVWLPVHKAAGLVNLDVPNWLRRLNAQGQSLDVGSGLAKVVGGDMAIGVTGSVDRKEVCERLRAVRWGKFVGHLVQRNVSLVIELGLGNGATF